MELDVSLGSNELKRKVKGLVAVRVTVNERGRWRQGLYELTFCIWKIQVGLELGHKEHGRRSGWMSGDG